MPTDDQINIGHIFRKNLVFRFIFIFHGTTMRYAGNHIHVLIFLNLFHRLLRSLNRIFKKQFACWRAIQRIFTKYTKNCYFDITFLYNYIIFHSVVLKCIFNLLLSFR